MNMYNDEEGDFYDDREILPRPENPKILKRKNLTVRVISYFFLLVLIGLIAYLVYFHFSESRSFENSSYNRRRIELLSEKYIRGSIYSADGEILSYTDCLSGKDVRVYPYSNVFSHVIGYSDNGGSGLEGAYHSVLLSSHTNIVSRARSLISGERINGDNIYTTLNSSLQQYCYNALGNNKGAVVIMDVETGAVLAMVSKPDYDPNDIVNNWDYYTSDNDAVESILLNRATQGLYPPGSTFKIITALTYLRENPDAMNSYSYDCAGSINYENNIINCYNSNRHGLIGFKESFAKSCNSSFVNIGISLNRKNLIDVCESFGMNKKMELVIPSSESKFLLTEESDTYELMQTVIGQGKTLVTPMQMAMVACSIANGGKLLKPYFLDHIETHNGVTIYKQKSKSYGRIMTDTEASNLQELMKEVVVSGTATSLSNKSFTAAGKTGSAEYGTDGNSHSWFTGYAPADDPKIAICVLVEGGGIGAERAVPITKKILEDYYN